MWCSSGGFFPSSILLSFYHIFTAFVFITMIILINYYIKYSVNFWVTTMKASNVSLLFFRLIYTIFIYIQVSRLKSSTRMRLWSLIDLVWFCEAVLLNRGHDSVILHSSADPVRSFILLNKAPDCSFGHYLILSVGFFSLPNVQWYKIQMQHSGF